MVGRFVRVWALQKKSDFDVKWPKVRKKVLPGEGGQECLFIL